MEDEKIVELYLERNENAIRCTSEKYGGRLRTVSFGITSDSQVAEECENDTYMQAWNLIPPNEPKTYFYAFLARIIRHISIDRCRERASLKRSAFIVELSEEMAGCLPAAGDADSEVSVKELGEAISDFLRTLSKEKRVVFVRRYFYLESIRDICKELDLGESKVKTSLFRIRRDLREYLNKRGYMI